MTTTVGGLVISDDRGSPCLLDDKLEVPGLGLALLRRARIDELMAQATRHRVALVTGPAGAGKTVACASWAAARPAGSRLGWLTLDAGDQQPDRFWRYLTTALARAGAITAADAGQFASGHVTDDVPQRVLSCIVADQDEPAVVVLDDVHELAGSDVLAGLDELIHRGPPGLRLVLAGRYAPGGLALAKLRLSGQIGDVGAADLACTSQEADAYLASMGAAADPAVRAAIVRQAEGWIAGLRLLSMAVPADSPGAGPVAPPDSGAGPADSADLTAPSLVAAHELVTDYLCDEILGPLPARMRLFLLRTCLTDVVPADLAHVLTGDSAAAARLEQLSRENGLVRLVGSSHDEYRYHPMLREVLETVLRRDHPDDVPVLLGQIARWHAGRGDVLAAVQAAALAGDWDFGLQALGEASPLAPPDSGWAALEQVLSSFPPDRRSNDVALACALAAARLWQGDPDGALPHLDCAEHVLATQPDAQSADKAGRLWLAALQVMRMASTGAELAGQRALAGRAHEESGSVPEHRATGLLWLALGCASIGQLDMQRARTELQHAGSQLAAGGLGSGRERARSWEAVALSCYGDLAKSTRIAAEVADGLRAGPDDDLAPILAVSQAIAHVARDEPEAAAMLLDQADQAVTGPQPAGEPAIRVLTGLVRTRIAINEENLAGARGLVRLLTELVAGESPAMAAVAALDAEISLAAGERERARATLTGLPADGTGASCSEARICRARLLMTDDDDKGALKLLEPVIVGPATAGPAALTSRLTALLTAVVAHRRLNQAAEAAERLEEALALAEPDDQCGAFIAGGLPIRSALTVLITPMSRCASFAGRILDRFDGRMPRITSQPSGTPLTESELAVLRFLPSHMTNQEIAESLFLSINTIKTHLSSVYRKLGVTSRRQAIAQGRRLDLL
jgi:LuxR family transcriptional regulator, maltose regulon positive regulatory protein